MPQVIYKHRNLAIISIFTICTLNAVVNGVLVGVTYDILVLHGIDLIFAISLIFTGFMFFTMFLFLHWIVDLWSGQLLKWSYEDRHKNSSIQSK